MKAEMEAHQLYIQFLTSSTDALLAFYGSLHKEEEKEKERETSSRQTVLGFAVFLLAATLLVACVYQRRRRPEPPVTSVLTAEVFERP